MSPQYGELRLTNSWDPSGSLRHPRKFQRVSRLGSVTAWHVVVGISQTLRRWTEAPPVFGRATITLGIGPHSSSTCSLTLSNTNLLSVPFVCTSFGSFSVAARKIWNSLPPALQMCTNPRHFSSSSQDSLFPAGLSIRLTPSFLHLRFGFCWPLCAIINYTYLLTYHTWPFYCNCNSPGLPWLTGDKNVCFWPVCYWNCFELFNLKEKFS